MPLQWRFSGRDDVIITLLIRRVGQRAQKLCEPLSAEYSSTGVGGFYRWGRGRIQAVGNVFDHVTEEYTRGAVDRVQHRRCGIEGQELLQCSREVGLMNPVGAASILDRFVVQDFSK